MMAATTSRRDMALSRDCAMLALLALPRFLSTKACTARAHARARGRVHVHVHALARVHVRRAQPSARAAACLHVGALRLDALRGAALLLELVGARGLEGVVVALVPRDRAVVEVEHVRADRVQKGARVRDDHERLAPPLQVLLEPQHRVQVEVVGRLVEQQHVGLDEERARLDVESRHIGDLGRASWPHRKPPIGP